MSLASHFTVEMTGHFTVEIGQRLFFLPRIESPVRLIMVELLTTLSIIASAVVESVR